MTEIVIRMAPDWRKPIKSLLNLRAAWLTIDKNPAVLKFVQGFWGLALVHFVFVGLLSRIWFLDPRLMAIAGVALFLCALFPARRLEIMAVGGELAMLVQPFRREIYEDLSPGLLAEAGFDIGSSRLIIAGIAAIFLLLCWVALRLQSRFPDNRLGRHPILVQATILAGLVLAATNGALSPFAIALLWTLIGVFASALWPFNYALAGIKSKTPVSPQIQLGYIRPVWGGNIAHIGKGVAFLRKFEAKDDAALAATRLKALKLIVWALILERFSYWLDDITIGGAKLPPLHDAILAAANGHGPDFLMSWAIVGMHFFSRVVTLAAGGHVAVAIVRMTGFNIPRNTARPLSARTLAEFWNRYIYYFKEILVDFFFFPAFTKYFRKSPKLRVAFATFSAAAVGNFFHHFVFGLGLAARSGLFGLWSAFQTYLVYVVILSAGIIISQLRNSRPKPEDGMLRYHVLPRVGVLLFFCLLAVFDDPVDPKADLIARLAFLKILVGA